jgi:SRSO17 transposase
VVEVMVMTARRPCPPAPGPLEAYAAGFDDLFGHLAQRRGFRAYLQGVLLPHDRHKTLTGLAGAEPVVQAQAAEVQRLQLFLSESGWDAEALNARRLDLLLQDPATRSHAHGILVLDDTGDRKKGSHTPHVGRQYLGSVGKVDNGIVAVSSLWADERVYYPLHVVPFTPGRWFPKGDKDPAYRSKPRLAVQLVEAALRAGVCFRAVVADCGYGEGTALEEALWTADIPYVLALRPSKGSWAPMGHPHTPEDAARALPWQGPAKPGGWIPIERTFRDGHTETWWAADLTFGGYGPDRRVRLIVATTDPVTLPAVSTWYLSTNLPRPGSPYAAEDRPAAADLAEVVRLYGLRNWVEQGYKQVKQELGWADFMVRSDRAIRRHWTLICCAFSFCWRTWFHDPPASEPAVAPARTSTAAGRGEKRRRSLPTGTPVLAGGVATGARLARPLDLPPPLLARLVGASATTARPARAAGRRRRRPTTIPLPPGVTK